MNVRLRSEQDRIPALGDDRVPAVTRAIKLLELVSQAKAGKSLSELSRALGVPKSSLLNICSALVAERLLKRDSFGTYRLGLRVAEFARAQIAYPPRLKVVGIAMQDPSNPFFAVEEAAAIAASQARDVRAIVKNARKSLETQIRQLGEFTDLGVDAVLVDAIDSNGVSPGLQVLRRAGIPVVAINTGAADCDASVATDNVQAGELVGRYLADSLPEGARVAIIGGNPVTAVSDRIVGFLSALRDYEAIRVVDRVDADQTETGGYKAAKKVLARHQKLDGLFAINDPTAIGACGALRDMKREMPVVSVDGSSAAVQMISEGKYIIATAAQDPRAIGNAGVELAERVLAGEVLTNRYRVLPPVLITSENVRSYQPWG